MSNNFVDSLKILILEIIVKEMFFFQLKYYLLITLKILIG